MHLASRPRAAPMRSITAATADLIGCRVAAKFGAEGKHTMARSMGANVRALIAAWLALLFACSTAAQSLAPDIVVVKTINAPVADVWKAWTTTEGIESFFAPKAAKVEPWPGGAFELWFGVEMPEGSRGSEGCKVHSVKPMEQFVFEWNAPPTIPAIRPLRTLVYLDFKSLADNRTEVMLRNFGYGQGEDWAKTKVYFERAWPAVMANLEKRFAPK